MVTWIEAQPVGASRVFAFSLPPPVFV